MNVIDDNTTLVNGNLFEDYTSGKFSSSLKADIEQLQSEESEETGVNTVFLAFSNSQDNINNLTEAVYNEYVDTTGSSDVFVIAVNMQSGNKLVGATTSKSVGISSENFDKLYTNLKQRFSNAQSVEAADLAAITSIIEVSNVIQDGEIGFSETENVGLAGELSDSQRENVEEGVGAISGMVEWLIRVGLALLLIGAFIGAVAFFMKKLKDSAVPTITEAQAKAKSEFNNRKTMYTSMFDEKVSDITSKASSVVDEHDLSTDLFSSSSKDFYYSSKIDTEESIISDMFDSSNSKNADNAKAHRATGESQQPDSPYTDEPDEIKKVSDKQPKEEPTPKKSHADELSDMFSSSDSLFGSDSSLGSLTGGSIFDDILKGDQK